MADHRLNWVLRLRNTAVVAVLARRERRVPFWPAERIAALQQKRMRAILRHAWRTVPFYRQAMRERGLRPEDFRTADDLALLPLLDDVLVRRDMEQFVSTAWSNRPRLTFRTSGAFSRTRKTIHWDYPASLRKLAIAERDRSVLNRLAGRGWGQVQVYLLPESSVSIEMRQFWDAWTWAPRGLARRHRLASSAPYEEAARLLDAVRPDVVFSYGSYADEFFRWLADRRVEVALPRVWAYGGDMMGPGSREIARRTFGCSVHSTYQAVETGRMGFQCERCDGFHLNTDYCAVRLIDEAGRPVPPGEPGEIVASNLFNRAMVLLNCRMGDVGVLSAAPCPCGRTLPVLAGLQGKVTQIVVLPDGRRIRASTVEWAFREDLAATLQAQLTQSGAREVLWRIVPLASTDPRAFARRLLERTGEVFGPDVAGRVEYVPDIPRSAAGKFQAIVPLAPAPG